MHRPFFYIIVFVHIAAYAFVTDPMLQMPEEDSVSVVWFTDGAHDANYVEYGDGFCRRVVAETTKLSKMREDGPSGSFPVNVYRHEARVCGIDGKTVYRAVSKENGEKTESAVFSCSPAPAKNTPLKILFTSDHQGKPMVAANLQKVKEVIPDIDAVFFAGDCCDHADKASEWFGENGFFACLQGRACKELGSGIYQGGAILQYAPIFCTIGNHEVMGREDNAKSLDNQFRNPYPEEGGFNCDSYLEIFNQPKSLSGGKKYYATTYGDIRLICLYATRIWRSADSNQKGKYSENPSDFSRPENFGYGDFIFEPVGKGSPQYDWLEKELQSPEFKQAKYTIVMLHNPLHSLGENAVPPFTDPVQEIETDEEGNIGAVRYRYPKENDYLIRDIEPLLERYGVHLVLCGHTHIWNRFCSAGGVHHLETSNVGNSYGAYLTEPRTILPTPEGDKDCVAFGDPAGLDPIIPSIAPLQDDKGLPLPFLSSNTITAFSVFDTQTGCIDSYYYDTSDPASPVVHFDRFGIGL